MKKIPLTKEGFETLRQELKQLKDIERPSIIKQISEAREHGDLSENAEYHAAREKQSFVEGKILELENICSLAEVINISDFDGNTVKFGCTVTIIDCDNNEKKVYTIVGDPEANISIGKIALSSPVSQSLIGKKIGDIITVNVPLGIKEYEIIDIKL